MRTLYSAPIASHCSTSDNNNMIWSSEDDTDSTMEVTETCKAAPITVDDDAMMLTIDSQRLKIQRRHRRRAHFNLLANTIHHDESRDEETWNNNKVHQKEARWFTVAEYQAFKLQRQRLLNELQADEEEALDRSTTTTTTTSCGYTSVLERVYEACCRQSGVMSDRDEGDLTQVLRMNHHHTLLGLERHVVPSIKWEKRGRRRQLVEAVLEMQDCFYPGSPQQQLHIAQVAAETSLPSRLFATMLAQAHYRAARA